MTAKPVTAHPDDTTESMIALLDAVDALPAAATLRERSYDLLGLAAGPRVADVGCGTGRAVAEMARAGAQAVGIDISEQMITVARQRWPGLDFRLGAAGQLPLAGGEADGYRADKVFHELAEPGPRAGRGPPHPRAGRAHRAHRAGLGHLRRRLR